MQRSFSDTAVGGKQTLQEMLLVEMNAVVPWQVLLAQIPPH